MKYKNTFVQGKMNKDIDERLLPKGQYSHAENISVTSTDGSDSGAVQNFKGNTSLTNFDLTNAKTIGVFSDNSNEKIYWCTTSDEKDMVVEYDVRNGQAITLLESSNPSGVLNFNRNNLITGIAKIINGDSSKDLILLTDDLNPPRMFNIERSKTYGIDGFTEDDISLIKKPPRFAPEIQLTYTPTTLENNLENKFISFSYRYKYLDGEYSALSSFSNYMFAPRQFDLDYQTMENNGMVNAFNAFNIIFNTGEKQVKDIELVFKESNSNSVYIIESFNKNEKGWVNNEVQSFQFSNSKLYTPLPEDQLYRQYDNVPRFAKCLELIGNRIVFSNYVEGYNLVNGFGQDVNIDYEVSVINKTLLGEQLPISLTSSNSTMVVDLTGVSLVKDSRLSFDISLTEVTYNDGSFSNNFDFILNQDYDNVSDLASDPDFIFFIESVMTGNFLQDYTALPPDDSELLSNSTFLIQSSTSTSISLLAPVLTYLIDDTPSDTSDNPSNTHTETSTWNFRDTSSAFFKEIAVDSSLKTNRSYEVGIIYMDEYGRATTVLTDATNTVYIPQEFSTYQNKLLININNFPPVWADRYKMVVKQNKGNYQTIYANIFYEDGLFRWIKLEGANKDKVKEGDTLIVKSDLGGAVDNLIKVRVLEITTKEKDFIEENQNIDGDDIIEDSGLYMKIKPSGFDMNFNDATSRTFEGSSHLRYPVNTHTHPNFGETNNGVFTPYSLGAGSTVRLFIKFEAKGAIEYKEVYDKTFKVSSDYDSVQSWFEAEVEDLGAFGDDFTRDWGFTSNGEQFFVRAHRDGTASRKIGTDVKFEILFSEGTVIFETEPFDSNSEIFYETQQTFEIEDNNHLGNIQDQTSSLPAIVELDFFNCYVQGNGAESYRYKDAFTIGENEIGQQVAANYLNIDFRPTSTSVEKYKEVRRFADLTFSQVYNENNNVNGLNEFNLSLINYKEDIDKKYGSVQKLHSRDTDLIVFQEDKVSKILYGKDLLMNADGTSNVSSIQDVLGQQITFTGEYGIGRNPESFAFDGFNIYFTDPKRGAVMKLTGDQLTEISRYGMRQFFRDQFKDSINTVKLGGFDSYKDQYVLHQSLDTLVLPIDVDCSTSIIRTDFIGELEINMDFGLSVGTAGFNYNITRGEATIQVIWNNSSVETLSNISGDGTVSFNKTLSAPTTAIIKIVSGSCMSFEIVGNCISTTNLNVINLVLNDALDSGLTMRSRYRWSTSSYISPFKSYFSTFGEENVDLFDELSGVEGVGNIPLTGSTILLESYKGVNETGSFEEGDRLGYLVSDMLLTKDNYEDIIDNATFLPVTETISASRDVSNTATFTFNRPNDEQYLYLIWDYLKNNSAPIAVDDNINVVRGQSRNIDITRNDSDPDNDPFTVIIDTQPSHGSVTANVSGTVSYTHDGSDNLVDSFTYHINDGTLDSNIATVNIAVGVGVGDGISTSGGTGIFLIPVVIGTEAGTFIIHCNAQIIPDRFEILFDPDNNPMDYTDSYNMPVVADSLFVGDGVSPTNPPNERVSNLDLNLYNGSSFDVVRSGTEGFTITDDIVTTSIGNRTDASPNGSARNGSNRTQVGAQNLVFTSQSDTLGTSDLKYSNGNIALRYNKPTTTAFIAYIRVSGTTNTGWNIYKTEFL